MDNEKEDRALALSVLKGKTSAAEAARKHGLTIAQVEEWKERFLSGAENALRSRPRNEEAMKDEEITRLKRKIGDLVMDIDILKEAQKPYLPTMPGTHDERSRRYQVHRSDGSAPCFR